MEGKSKKKRNNNLLKVLFKNITRKQTIRERRKFPTAMGQTNIRIFINTTRRKTNMGMKPALYYALKKCAEYSSQNCYWG